MFIRDPDRAVIDVHSTGPTANVFDDGSTPVPIYNGSQQVYTY